MVTVPPLHVVFFGTPAFAVPTLDALLASTHDVVGVVTQPDRPSGRGQKTTDAPVKARARAADLAILQPNALREPGFLSSLGALKADLGVVAAYGRILPESVLATPRLGMINVHASLLPRYRGAAPVHRAVIAGDNETGVTIMRVVKALDAGPMLATARRPIATDETSVDVERALATLGAALLIQTVDRLASGAVPEIDQDESAATYANRLTKDEGLIAWSKPAADIHNLVRGLHPWPHAFTFLESQRIIVLRTRAAERYPNVDAGTIVSAQGDTLEVAAGLGAVEILELQPEGRRAMGPREFLAGHRLAPGDRFTNPP
jgi:methionyl-tRNA formyltransferase